MAGIELNRLARGLRDLCSRLVLEEKWVLAPSLRAGMQWLDAVARSGQPVLNARVKTISRMALELAVPEMERRGLAFARGLRLELLVNELLQSRRGGSGYLGRLEMSPGLAKAAAAVLADLRMAGIAADSLSPALFEIPLKGKEMASLFTAYEKELSSRALADPAEVLRLAADRLREHPEILPRDCVIALPEDMLEKMRALERALWETVPEGRRMILETDRPCEERAGEASEAALLAWLPRPADAPARPRDGSVEMLRAVGEVNEVREVLRRCASRGIPFDQVEILHTDYATYVPLFYEVCSAAAGDGSEVPVTFSEGIPVRYSRPGRALAAWTSWIAEDFPQATLVRMLQDGLLETGTGTEGWGFSSLGAALRSLPIGGGRERYLEVVDAEIAFLDERMAGRAEEERDDEVDEGGAFLEKRAMMLSALREIVRELLADIATGAGNRDGLLAAAESFLLRRARCASEFDAYARRRLLDEVRELSACLREHPATSIDPLGWLADIARSVRVEGKGPRPGCLHVAPLMGGGHSGRPHTFILGLDDGRFPGAGLQDPLLLDSEREALSGDLPTAAGRMATVMEDLARVAARTRGTVTLGYCCRSLADDRDMFPSPAVLAAYRIVSGNREAVQDDLLRELPDPVSFAPLDAESCISGAEWWVSRLCAGPAVSDAEGVVAAAFPHLGRGREARRARESDLFTPYDGYVPEAGRDLDPARPDGPVLSARRLETLGRCPLEFFFAYALGIRPPEEFALDPSRWLEAAERGDLLHSVFKDFHLRLREAGLTPTLERDWELLREILEGRMAAWERRKPPPNREVARVEREDLLRCARIFLREEEEYCRENRPLYFEVAVGMERDGEGNPIDSGDPVSVALPGEEAVRTRGFIDRVDELGGPGSGAFCVIDYKTGSTYGYDPADPFRGGRYIQSYLYLAQAEELLARRHPGARVDSFQYFFASTRGRGERIAWGKEGLAGGPRVLAALRGMIARGCFPFTDDVEDVKFSDYLLAFGDVAAAAESTRRKLARADNEALAPFRELRESAGGADD